MAFLDIKQRTQGNALVIEFHGEIDKATVEMYKNTVTPLIDGDAVALVAKVVFDCSDLKFINSEGIGLLMSYHTKLSKREKKIILAGLQPNVKDIFDLIGLTKLIPVFPDAASALA